jgi:hypothetical protein
MFNYDSKLENIDLPNAKYIGSYAFSECSALTSVNLQNATSIRNRAFNGCRVLTTLILRGSTVCTLDSTSLYNTPFASNGAGGTVYVPQALIESYQTATNWSALYAAGTCNFVAIEGSEYE